MIRVSVFTLFIHAMTFIIFALIVVKTYAYFKIYGHTHVLFIKVNISESYLSACFN